LVGVTENRLRNSLVFSRNKTKLLHLSLTVEPGGGVISGNPSCDNLINVDSFQTFIEVHSEQMLEATGPAPFYVHTRKTNSKIYQ
jgi:hypothetical protein